MEYIRLSIEYRIHKKDQLCLCEAKREIADCLLVDEKTTQEKINGIHEPLVISSAQKSIQTARIRMEFHVSRCFFILLFLFYAHKHEPLR